MSRDTAQIAAIKNYGMDPGKERWIDLTFWAPDERCAKAFADACKRNEMSPSMQLGPSAAGTDQRWLIRCTIKASVAGVSGEENLCTFIMFADKFDCQDDGWGTAVVEAAGPMTPVPESPFFFSTNPSLTGPNELEGLLGTPRVLEV
jgi:hypothetical protein